MYYAAAAVVCLPFRPAVLYQHCPTACTVMIASIASVIPKKDMQQSMPTHALCQMVSAFVHNPTGAQRQAQDFLQR